MTTDPSLLTVSQYFSYLTENDAYAATLYEDDDEMSGPGLDWKTVNDVIASEDDHFEDTVTRLNMRELLDLVQGLQGSMAEEQEHFDELSLQLEMLGGATVQVPDEHQAALSGALCSSQMRLARLCTRNMRCFTQQAVRAKQNHQLITRGSSKESSPASSPSPPLSTPHHKDKDLPYKDEVSFKDRLRFFQQGPEGSIRRDGSPPRHTWDPADHWTPSQQPDGSDPSSAVGEATLLENSRHHHRGPTLGGAAVGPSPPPRNRRQHPNSTVEEDLDAEAFVVHRTEFDEGDFLAEDGYSSVTEDHDVSSGAVNVTVTTPEDDDEDDDDEVGEDDNSERRVQEVEDEDSQDSDEEGDEDAEDDFVDNSAAYVQQAASANSQQQDPRGRYVYYPDDKELEVILEEDEEDLEDTDVEDIRARYLMTRRPPIDDDSTCSESSEDEDKKRTPAEGESDSGVPDEGSSSPLPDEISSHKETIIQREDSLKVSSPPDGEEDSAHDSSMAQQQRKEEEVEGSSSWVPSSKTSGRTKHPLITSIFNNTRPQSHSSISNNNNQNSPSTSPDSLKRESESPYWNENGVTSAAKEDQQPIIHRSEVTLHMSNRVKDMVNQLNGKTTQEEVEATLPQLANGSSTNEPPELVRPRSNTLQWDPSDLLAELYKPMAVNERPETDHGRLVTIEGYLEKLPSGKRKATYWNPWKRRYFKVNDSHIHCYDNCQSDEPKLSIMLMGATVERLDEISIGIDDRKGRFVTLRCQDPEEADDWLDVLSWHSEADNFSSTYVHPVMYPLKSHKNIIIVDLGSCSTRAGILMDHPTLPQVFFPTVCATNKQSQKQVLGSEALLPHIRQQSTVTFPIMPTAKITKYTMDVEALPALFKKVFTELNVDPKQYTVLVCIPRSFSLHTQVALSEVLLEDFGVVGVNLTHQAVLTLYAYRASSGVVVDIGDRMDIIPISQGYIVENGISRVPYGGRRIAHHLNHTLAQKQISLLSDVESYLLRYLLEQGCYISENYEKELERYRYDPEAIEKTIPVKAFYQDQVPFENISIEQGRFHAPEGLFQPRLWGLDSPGLAKLVHRAIQECGMDLRREMARSIYLSGGVTCLPGFPQRLEAEVDRLMPPSVTPKVHASPYRYHMAYLGACQLAQSSEFDNVCVTRQEWRTNGKACLKKWHL